MPIALNKAVASLGGKPLLLAGEDISWPLRPGVTPTIATFTMAPRDALALAQPQSPIELLINPPEGMPVYVQNLWVLNISPGADPYQSKVTVADRRWFWDRSHIVGRYNVRRAVGVKRLLANGLELENVSFQAGPDIDYWAYSLKNGVKYTAVSLFADLMFKVSQIELAYHGKTFTTVMDNRIGQNINTLSLEDVQIDHKGHEAVLTALSYLPEADITVDYDGTVVIFSKASGDEVEIVKALMPEIFGRGHTDLVKNNLIRPKQIDVLFTREVEIRFDYVETSDARSQTIVSEPLGDRRELDNVLPIPDHQLDIALASGTITYPQGSWITVDQAFRSWGNLPIFGPPTRLLDHDLVQRAFIPHMDLWAALGLIGELPDNNSTLQPWVPRVATVQKHYRTTFRLNRRWTDRFFSFRAYRLSTIDLESGQRGPSMAYGDYCILPTQRSNYRNIQNGQPMYYAINKTSYPGGRDANGNLVNNEINNFDSTAIPSPGIISVVDHDQGIIHVDYASDINRTYEMVLPSQIQLDAMPTADFTQRQRPIAFNEIVHADRAPRLSSSFRLAVILTAVPASPNSAQQLHRIVVTPNDVKPLLPHAAQRGLDEAFGPILEVRIGPGVEVARIAWKDTKSAVIEQIFGLTSVGDDPRSQEAFSQNVSSLCLNEGATGGKNGASLNEIAKAKAASIYASLVDRYEDSITGYMNGNVHLAGWISEINHVYTNRGEVLTKVTFPAAIPQFSLHAFLSASERAIILRQVQPQ